MIEATRLRTEYMLDPMGIDMQHPWLMWNVQSAKKQSAYEVWYQINQNEEKHFKAQNTDEMHFEFREQLYSRDRVTWKVRLTDEQGITGAWSEPHFFEMGLLNQKDDWRARWIMGNYEHSSNPKVRYPADYFKKEVAIHKRVTKARLYITACGIYEVSINGKKVGDVVLAPGSTAFQKRVHYHCFDVTHFFNSKDNYTLEVVLADGYYASKTGCFDHAKVYGYEPKFLAQLEIAYADASQEYIITDKTWKWSNDGQVRFADMKDGEIIDALAVPSYGGSARETVYHGTICSANANPPKEEEIFTDPRVISCPDGNIVLDFRQNIAGFLACDWCVPKGHTLSMICGEKLNAEGNFTISSLVLKGDYQIGHFQRIDYTGNGEPSSYKTRFSAMGFRYVLLINWPKTVDPVKLRAIAVYSHMDTTADFECSDANVDQIVKNTLWSIRGNFLDVPTDCPTRERAGWTGDAQVFFNTGNYFMDQASFFRKWLVDITDCQARNGMVYNVNPQVPGNNRLYNWILMEGSCGWGDALIMIPYRYWKRYGDIRLAQQHWDSMTACFKYFKSRMGKSVPFSGIKKSPYKKWACGKGRGFGEWTEPSDCAPKLYELLKPLCEENTAYLGYDARLMWEMADALHKKQAAKYYARLYKKIKEAYEYYFFDKALNEPKRECKLVRPCGLDMVSEANKCKLRQKLVRFCEKRDNTVGTGFLSTPFLLEELTEAGRPELAWKVLTNPDLGWVQQVKMGATTIWENWTDDASLNHYSKGSCCEWLFKDVCGIQLDGKPNHFIVKPHMIDDVEKISLSYRSVYGEISVAVCNKENKKYIMLTVPPNCTADVVKYNSSKILYGPGEYTLEW